jgi:hypothetical protein
MSSRSLASALKDFGARNQRAAEPFFAMPQLDEPVFEMSSLADVSVPFDAAPDTDALIAEAVAAAEQALSARLADDHAEALRLERERHEEELAALQQQVTDEASARMQAAIDESEQRIVELTSAVVARILGGLLTDDVRDRSLARLSDTIREALHDNDALRIRVRGSPPLYEALKARLERHADQLDFTETPTFDISVTIDDSVYETRLAEWSAALAEALA